MPCLFYRKYWHWYISNKKKNQRKLWFPKAFLQFLDSFRKKKNRTKLKPTLWTMRKLTFLKVVIFWHGPFFIFTFLPLVTTKSTLFFQRSKVLKLAPWKKSVGSILFQICCEVDWPGAMPYLKKDSGCHLLNFL